MRESYISLDSPTINFIDDMCLDGDPYELFYDIEENVIYDDCGFIIHDIFSFISPNDLFLLRKNKKDMVVYDKYGHRVELYYGYVID